MADKPAATAPKTRTRIPGTHALHVTINDTLYDKLMSTADGRPINVWLSKLVERHIPKVEELGPKSLFPEG